MEAKPEVRNHNPAFIDVLKSQTYVRGAPSPLVKLRGNPHLQVRPLRQAAYARWAIQADIKEEFPVWCKEKKKVKWDKATVRGDSSDPLMDALLSDPEKAVEHFFPEVSTKPPEGVGHKEWNKHLFAVHSVVYEICGAVSGVSLFSALSTYQKAHRASHLWEKSTAAPRDSKRPRIATPKPKKEETPKKRRKKDPFVPNRKLTDEQKKQKEEEQINKKAVAEKQPPPKKKSTPDNITVAQAAHVAMQKEERQKKKTAEKQSPKKKRKKKTGEKQQPQEKKTAEKQQPQKKKTAEKQQPQEKKKTAEKQQPQEKKKTAEKQQPIGIQDRFLSTGLNRKQRRAAEIAAEKQQSQKKKTAEKQQPQEKKIVEKQQPQEKKKTAEKQQPQKKKTGEKQQPQEKKKTAEKQQPQKKKTAEKQQPSGKKVAQNQESPAPLNRKQRRAAEIAARQQQSPNGATQGYSHQSHDKCNGA